MGIMLSYGEVVRRLPLLIKGLCPARLRVALNFALVAWMLSTAAGANCEGQPQSGVNYGARSGCFDFYVFTQTWQPEYCYARASNSKACMNRLKQNNPLGFGVHGLWPTYYDVQQQESYPLYCSDSPGCTGQYACQLDYDRINSKFGSTLSRLIPIRRHRLIQGEWRKHGTCSGLLPQQYFKLLIRIERQLVMPKIVRQSVGHRIGYLKLADAYGGIDYIDLRCKRSKGSPRYYLYEIQSYWNKKGERIKRPVHAQSSCPRHAPIYIRSVN